MDGGARLLFCLPEQCLPLLHDGAIHEIIDAHGVPDSGERRVRFFHRLFGALAEDVVDGIDVVLPFCAFGADRGKRGR